MSTRSLWALVLILAIVIVVLSWFLFALPVQAPTIATSTPSATVATTTVDTATTTSPLAARVKVTSPASGSTVGQTFEIAGEAPGPWYFEASFPIQVRDPDGNVLGRVGASAQGAWMVEGQVQFKATMILDGTYKGPATLILMKDNPSGLPENDDAVEIPIVIQ